MKFFLVFILSLLFIDIIIGCKPKACPMGTYMECPKRNRTTTRITNDYRKRIDRCIGNWDCACIKIKDYEKSFKSENKTKEKFPYKISEERGPIKVRVNKDILKLMIKN